MPFFTEAGLETFIKPVFNIDTAPTTLYFCLLIDAPTPLSTGTTILEPVGGYSRVAFDNDANFWLYTSNGIVINKETITFPKSTDWWGNITYWGICSAITAGNLLLWDSFKVPIEVVSDQTVEILSYSLSFNIKGV